jgi:3-phytase
MAGGITAGIAGCVRLDRDDDDTPSVEEAFVTPEEGENIDQPAVWHGNGDHLLLVTAKGSHELVVFDATNGEYLGSIGEEGSALGEFQRPNGLYVIDDLAVVVERDNRRVQVLRLPDGEPVGTFGDDRLRKPYEGMVYGGADGYEIYVTDDYDASGPSDLGERVKHYRFTVSNGDLSAQHVKTFGATDGPGALYAVESIFADPDHGRLLIADEDDYAMKLYDLEGEFVDVVTSVFDEDEGNDPEGITLYRNDDGSGYWLFTEQSGHDDSLFFERARSKFHVFDRESFEYLTVFSGEETVNTDGVWLTQSGFGPFPSGAFYAVHDDIAVSAFDWDDIVEATGIE